MKYISFFFCVFLISACTCEEEGITTIAEPDPFYVVQLGGGDDFFFIEFSKPADPNVFSYNSNAFFSPVDFCNANVTWSNDNKIVSYCAGFLDCTFDPVFTCFVDVLLLGTEKDGAVPVRSLAGQILDGDFDGTDGGDYVKSINVFP